MSLTGLATAPAHGAIITGTLAFTASGFPAGAPTDPVIGSVSYSFDGAIVNGAPLQVSVSGLNLPGAWIPVVTYSPTINNVFPPDLLAVGHQLNGMVVNPRCVNRSPPDRERRGCIEVSAKGG